MKGIIILTPITEKAKLKFKEHIKDTTLNDRIKMKRQGVSQKLEGENIIIQFKDLRINFLAKHFENDYIFMMSANKSRLVEEMEKLGMEEDKDFEVLIE